MKTQTIAIMVLALTAMGPLGTGHAQVSLTPSLTPFKHANATLPEWDGFKPYKGLRGNIPNGVYIGGSVDVAYWFQEMRKDQWPLAQNRDYLDQDLEVYIDTVNEDGATLVKKLGLTTQAKLDALNGKSSGNVFKMLKDYRLVRARQTKAQLGVDAAWKDVNSAIASVDADGAVITQRDLAFEKSSLEAKKKAILEKAKKAAWLGQAVSFARSAISTIKSFKDPTVLGEYLFDKTIAAFDEALVNNVLLENWQTLKEIDDRVTAIDSALKTAKETELQGRLTASKEKLAAARLRLIQAEIDQKLASLEGWDYIDQLAALERSYKSTDVFGALQTYNFAIRRQGDQIRDHGYSYLSVLEAGPGLSPRTLVAIDKDIAYVSDLNSKTQLAQSGMNGDFAGWLRQAQQTRDFMKVHRDWYVAERTEVQRQIGAVQSGKHLALIEATVNKVLDLLGSSTDI